MRTLGIIPNAESCDKGHSVSSIAPSSSLPPVHPVDKQQNEPNKVQIWPSFSPT